MAERCRVNLGHPDINERLDDSESIKTKISKDKVSGKTLKVTGGASVS